MFLSVVEKYPTISHGFGGIRPLGLMRTVDLAYITRPTASGGNILEGLSAFQATLRTEEPKKMGGFTYSFGEPNRVCCVRRPVRRRVPCEKISSGPYGEENMAIVFCKSLVEIGLAMAVNEPDCFRERVLCILPEAEFAFLVAAIVKLQ
jgi:hypothetical protein